MRFQGYGAPYRYETCEDTVRFRDVRHDLWVGFFETFSPVAGLHVLRSVLATTSPKEWGLRAPNFKQATRSENVWLELPDSSVVNAANVIIYLVSITSLTCSEWYKEFRRTILDEKRTSRFNTTVEQMMSASGSARRTSTILSSSGTKQRRSKRSY